MGQVVCGSIMTNEVPSSVIETPEALVHRRPTSAGRTRRVHGFGRGHPTSRPLGEDVRALDDTAPAAPCDLRTRGAAPSNSSSSEHDAPPSTEAAAREEGRGRQRRGRLICPQTVSHSHGHTLTKLTKGSAFEASRTTWSSGPGWPRRDWWTGTEGAGWVRSGFMSSSTSKVSLSRFAEDMSRKTAVPALRGWPAISVASPGAEVVVEAQRFGGADETGWPGMTPGAPEVMSIARGDRFFWVSWVTHRSAQDDHFHFRRITVRVTSSPRSPLPGWGIAVFPEQHTCG